MKIIHQERWLRFSVNWWFIRSYKLSLYIKQPTSSTSISGYEDEEPEWAEYKIKESNMFTVDKYQQVSPSNALNRKIELWCLFMISISFLIPTVISLQIGFFPKEKAFALRYQTAGMLENVLRQGVLGEDDTGEESPRWSNCSSYIYLLFVKLNTYFVYSPLLKLYFV